jgi:hypothetical protein
MLRFRLRLSAKHPNWARRRRPPFCRVANFLFGRSATIARCAKFWLAGSDSCCDPASQAGHYGILCAATKNPFKFRLNMNFRRIAFDLSIEEKAAFNTVRQQSIRSKDFILSLLSYNNFCHTIRVYLFCSAPTMRETAPAV